MDESKESIAPQQSYAPRTCNCAAHKVMPARICILLFAHVECEVPCSNSDPADCMKRRSSILVTAGIALQRAAFSKVLEQRFTSEPFM